MSSTVGQIAKDCKRFSVNASSFSDISKSTFISIYEELKDIFDMPPYEDISRWLHHTLLQRWKDYKYHLRVEHFDPYTTTKDRFAHYPENVDIDQWQSIVRYWESDDFQVISQHNKRNHAKLVALSTSRNTTHTNKFYKLKQKEGQSPPRVRNLKLNHTRKNGKPVNEATGELMESTDRDDILFEVLGKDSCGHVWGFGGAVTPESVFGLSSSRGGGQEYCRLKDEVVTLREGQGTMMEEIEQMKMLIAQLTGTMVYPTFHWSCMWAFMAVRLNHSPSLELHVSDMIVEFAHDPASPEMCKLKITAKIARSVNIRLSTPHLTIETCARSDFLRSEDDNMLWVMC